MYHPQREERAILRGVKSTPKEVKIEPISLKDLDVPSLDWRTKGAVTSVKDQGICGSCWSFGSAEAVSGAVAVKYGRLVPLSQQALMDCSWGKLWMLMRHTISETFAAGVLVS